MGVGWLFQLSDRQHWELTRGHGLLIALPYPTIEPSNWFTWAQFVLPDAAPLVAAASPDEIRIRVPLRGGSDLTHILGQIYPDLVPDSALAQRVIVISVLLCLDPSNPRKISGPRWPKSAFRIGELSQKFGGRYSNGSQYSRK